MVAVAGPTLKTLKKYRDDLANDGITIPKAASLLRGKFWRQTGKVRDFLSPLALLAAPKTTPASFCYALSIISGTPYTDITILQVSKTPLSTDLKYNDNNLTRLIRFDNECKVDAPLAALTHQTSPRLL
jgi:hypothetical protein